MKSSRALLPQRGRSFHVVFGAWRKCLLRQALGARQAGAGGGPCHTSYAQKIHCKHLGILCAFDRLASLHYNTNSYASSRIALRRSSSLHKVMFLDVSLHYILRDPGGRPCRCRGVLFTCSLEPGESACCGRRWAPGRQGQAGAPAICAKNSSRGVTCPKTSPSIARAQSRAKA